MGKIVIKDNSANAADAETPAETKVSVGMKSETKTEAKPEKAKKSKAKSSITPGSELVVAPMRAVAVVNRKKPVGANAAGAGKKKAVRGEGVSKGPDAKTAVRAGENNGSGSKKSKKSVSGIVIDSTVVAAGSKMKVDAQVDGYAMDDTKAGKDIKLDQDKTKAKDDKTKKTGTGKPRFSKPKSALIGVGVALVVAIIGFVAIWFFSRKPAEMCVVQFEPNGGSQVNAQSIVCGTLAQEPEAPTKDGFDFKGWGYEGLPFDFEKDKVSKNIVLVAWWEEHPDTEVVRISFDTAGGSTMESIKIKKGGVLETITAVPTKAGYIFAGWYLDDEPFDYLQTIDEDITLTAKWKEDTQGSSNNGGSSANNSGSSSNNATPPVTVGSCDPMARGDVQGVTVEVGSTVKLAATLAYFSITNCNVSFRTNDTVKVALSGNTLKGLVAGDAKVSVCLSGVDGKEVECIEIPVKVTEKVTEPTVVPVTGVEIIEGSKTNLTVGETVQLYERVLPTNATDKTAKWTSSDSAVVEVSESGLMKAVGAGTATLTVTTKDGGKTASVVVTVAAKEEPPVEVPEECGDGEVKDENGVCVKKPEGGDGTEPGEAED